MAVYGIGIDLVRIDRIQRSLSRWGDRFARRVFTARERDYCARSRHPQSCYAMRFAAKEAFVKAVGLGVKHPLHWRDMEVNHDPRGRPFISLSERATAYCRSLGITSWHLSLTDDGAYGAAVVVIEQ